MNRRLIAVFGSVAASALTGCLVLPPIPIPPSGTKGNAVEQLQIGKTDRADVHGLIGEPNRLASPRHDVWELEHDPFHIYLFIALAGPGGGMGGPIGPVYFGDDTGSRARAAVDYDSESKVAGWRWEARTLAPVSSFDTKQSRDFLYGASEPGPLPRQPSQVLPWRAIAYALSPDGRHAALVEKSNRVEVIEIPSGRQIAASTDWADICGREGITLGYTDKGIVSLSAKGSRQGSFCRWREEAGKLIADVDRDSDLAREIERSHWARLIGQFVVADREDGGISVWNVSGALVTMLGPDRLGYIAGSATVSAAGGLLAVERGVEYNAPHDALPTLILHDIATATQRAFTLPGPADRPLVLARLTLSPNGDLLAIHRYTHIEVWRVGDLDNPPLLEAALPLPPPMMAGDLEFLPDGSHLITTSADFALVWKTEDWSLVGRVTSGWFPDARTPSGTLELNPDGSQIATGTGLWRIAP